MIWLLKIVYYGHSVMTNKRGWYTYYCARYVSRPKTEIFAGMSAG